MGAGCGRGDRARRPGQVPGDERAERRRRGGADSLAFAGDYAWLPKPSPALARPPARAMDQRRSETARSLIELFWDKRGRRIFHLRERRRRADRPDEGFAGRGHSVRQCRQPPSPWPGWASSPGTARFTDTARQTVGCVAPALSRAPVAFPGLTMAATYLSRPRRQVVIASSEEPLSARSRRRFLPDTVLAWGEPFASPLWEGRDGPDAAGRAFVCEAYTCQLPVTTPDELAALLDQRPGSPPGMFANLVMTVAGTLPADVPGTQISPSTYSPPLTAIIATRCAIVLH